MSSITEELARRLINFAPLRSKQSTAFGESQLRGSVAALNMLGRNRIAYLADEVGMGKTYVALGVMGLYRHLNPGARIMVIAPRENIQLKWEKELFNFVGSNWLVNDNRFKAIGGGLVREPVICGSTEDFARASSIHESADLFLRMTSFSISSKDLESQRRHRKRVRRIVRWLPRWVMRTRDPYLFREHYGATLNAVMPDIDLLVIDEAHNLRRGFRGTRVSNRNRLLGLALGNSAFELADEFEWFKPRVKNVLLLSATPFEYDYADLWRQLDVLGFGDESLSPLDSDDPLPLEFLAAKDDLVSEEEKREVVRRMMIRRVAHLNIAGKPRSKNLYRREWRQGGIASHDDALHVTDPKERLTVALMQKKVAEVLGDKRFNRSFQIGMLSSFESFLESMKRASDDEPVFDGDQDADERERRGVDSEAIGRIARSHQTTFGTPLPHPKLDATIRELSQTFDTGEKTLVFVRRVATVAELEARLDAVFDAWLEARMQRELPRLAGEVTKLFRDYRRQRRREPSPALDDSQPADGSASLGYVVEDDAGDTDSFFAWFFRGNGPKGVLSGAAFQKNRLASASATHANLFERNYVAELLGYPSDVVGALASELDCERAALEARLRDAAYGFFARRTQQKEGYPRFYVFESYQAAALHELEHASGSLGEEASVILSERFRTSQVTTEEPRPGFPGARDALEEDTFFTALVKRPRLRVAIWPEEWHEDFRDGFRRSEQRRELISAMCRLGAAFIDLYLVAMQDAESFELRGGREAQNLATGFLDRLEKQSEEGGFGAYYELSHAAAAFDEVLSVNFPTARAGRLESLPELYGATLQAQRPVGGMAGSVNRRLVSQFRMPGFPLVMFTTDVLQEGEDLHTFCHKVMHYGITWTPSAMEQRTGRVDRIGSLTQRRLDGSSHEPSPDELIQVYFPHLQDTVEVLQVRRVLQRLMKFITMVNEIAPEEASYSSSIDVAREILRTTDEIPVIDALLESAFPVRDEWLKGSMGPEAASVPAFDRSRKLVNEIWNHVTTHYRIQPVRTGNPWRLAGTAQLRAGCLMPADSNGDAERRQPFDLEVTSNGSNDDLVIRCISPVGLLALDPRRPEALNQLYNLQMELTLPRVCTRHDARKGQYFVSLESDRLLDVSVTQLSEVEELVVQTVEKADWLEEQFFPEDSDPTEWHKRRGQSA